MTQPAAAHSRVIRLARAQIGDQANQRRDNLPAQLTSFVGRDHEVADVRALVTTNRLVTIYGVGGVGKTRLAHEAASGLVGRYSDGVWLAPLAGLAEPALVPGAIASTLGIVPRPGCSSTEALADELRAQELLLILDNCEHVVSACAVLAENLLRACARLRILATSREILAIAGETCWQLHPLSLPNPQEMRRANAALTALVAEHGAPRLFVDRAQSALTGFVTTTDNAAAIVDICRRLDGLPLAIELAAAQIRMLTPVQIAERLSDRFSLLASGSRTAMARHQTLRALVDWSYDLLTPAEQTLLRRLSIFAGSWTLEAAESICSDGSLAQKDVLGCLSQLVTKSLVVAEEQRSEVRYKLLQTINDYAYERLRNYGEDVTFKDRHRNWFLGVAQRTDPELAESLQTESLDRLELEIDNFRAALQWSLSDEARAEVGLTLAANLNGLWSPRGLQTEGRRWLADLLARAPRASAARAEGLNRAGYLALRQGDHAAAQALLDESQALWQQLGSPVGLAAARQYAGMVAEGQADRVHATALLEQSLAVFRERGPAWRMRMAILSLGDIAYAQTDYARAAALYAEALANARCDGNTHDVGKALCGMGLIELAEHNLDQAMALLRESLARFGQLRDRKCGTFCLEAFAFAAACQRQPERAARLFGAAQHARSEIGIVQAPAQREDHERGLAVIRAAIGEEHVNEALAAGQALTLEQAIDYALADEPSCAVRTTRTLRDEDPAALTRRERDITELIARGCTNQQIAQSLVLSVRTVERHIENIYEKLGVHGKAARAAATAFALRHRLVEPG